jgi:hypothetical protein
MSVISQNVPAGFIEGYAGRNSGTNGKKESGGAGLDRFRRRAPNLPKCGRPFVPGEVVF